MTIGQFLASAELELKRCFIADESYQKYIRDLTKAYDAGRNQNLEEWKVLEKNYDDLYDRTRWHFPAKGELPADAGAKLVLLDFGSLGKEYGIRENLNSDVQKDVVAWCEIIPPKEEANDSKEVN